MFVVLGICSDNICCVNLGFLLVLLNLNSCIINLFMSMFKGVKLDILMVVCVIKSSFCMMNIMIL